MTKQNLIWHCRPLLNNILGASLHYYYTTSNYFPTPSFFLYVITSIEIPKIIPATSCYYYNNTAIIVLSSFRISEQHLLILRLNSYLSPHHLLCVLKKTLPLPKPISLTRVQLVLLRSVQLVLLMLIICK